MIKDKSNKPDKGVRGDIHAEYSALESAYWQMLISKEAHTSNDDDYAKNDVEHMFNVWNERFGTNVQPRWKRDI